MSTNEKSHYLNAAHTFKSWALTLDHKRIGILYLVTLTMFFMIGGLFAAGIRLELFTPEGDVMSSEMYNRFFTLHGVVMIFFFLVPSIPAVLGNFLLPLMIGAKDVAFPRLNLLSYYVYLTGGILALIIAVFGGLDTGWTFYTPYSSTYSNSNVLLAGITVFITGFSSILTGLNFVVTVHKMRAPGMTWFRLPLFVWAQYGTGLIMLLATPVLAITIALMTMERAFHIGIFDPNYGGDPVLFQHMFWFYSHPAVYIMILPSMGVMSELIACFSRKRIFGYKLVAYSTLAIAIIGFIVWGHHMFTTGQSAYASLVFSFITFFVAVPSAIKTFNWTATMFRGSISWQSPMVFAMGYLGLFMIGGLTGVFLSNMGLDIHLHDTYFVVAHFHYIMVGGAIFGYTGGLHFWWPKITGKLYSEFWAKISALLIFAGFNATFFPQFLLGYLGMPRRYHYYPEEFQILNVLSTAGAGILGLGYLLPAIYLPLSLKFGKKAPANPWGAKGLEWEKADSPPDQHNFETTPIVTEEAYAYSGKETGHE